MQSIMSFNSSVEINSTFNFGVDEAQLFSDKTSLWESEVNLSSPL